MKGCIEISVTVPECIEVSATVPECISIEPYGDEYEGGSIIGLDGEYEVDNVQYFKTPSVYYYAGLAARYLFVMFSEASIDNVIYHQGVCRVDITVVNGVVTDILGVSGIVTVTDGGKVVREDVNNANNAQMSAMSLGGDGKIYTITPDTEGGGRNASRIYKFDPAFMFSLDFVQLSESSGLRTFDGVLTLGNFGGDIPLYLSAWSMYHAYFIDYMQGSHLVNLLSDTFCLTNEGIVSNAQNNFPDDKFSYCAEHSFTIDTVPSYNKVVNYQREPKDINEIIGGRDSAGYWYDQLENWNTCNTLQNPYDVQMGVTLNKANYMADVNGSNIPKSSNNFYGINGRLVKDYAWGSVIHAVYGQEMIVRGMGEEGGDYSTNFYYVKNVDYRSAVHLSLDIKQAINAGYSLFEDTPYVKIEEWETADKKTDRGYMWKSDKYIQIYHGIYNTETNVWKKMGIEGGHESALDPSYPYMSPTVAGGSVIYAKYVPGETTKIVVRPLETWFDEK